MVYFYNILGLLFSIMYGKTDPVCCETAEQHIRLLRSVDHHLLHSACRQLAFHLQKRPHVTTPL